MSRQEGLIELPNGDRIFYDDAKHAYYRARQIKGEGGDWVRSTRLTGASTLCKPYSYDSGRLLAWKERITCEGIATMFNHSVERSRGEFGGLEWLTDGDVIRARLKEHGQDADSVRDRKADVGTRAHGVLEALAAGEDPSAQDGYGQAVINWWRERKPFVLNCEQFVYSATHGYAGRFDLRCSIPQRESGSHILTYLIDLKTSGWIAPSMHVQLALYELAAKECGVGESEERMILQVKDDGTYREVPCRATEQDALNAIAVYRGAGRIERESGLPKAKAA
jgi:hypothetical protein